MSKSIRATAPPTIANLAVGFDILGLAVQGEGDIVTAAYSDTPGLRIDRITGDGGKLSSDIHINCISAGIIALLDDLKERAPGFNQGIVLSLDKRMPLGSGMGSSASSAAASVIAVNALLGEPFTKQELMRYALIGESVASGAIHGDNVIPSLMGGLILMRENEPADALQIPFIEDLYIVLVHPHVEVMTEASRGRLSETIALKEHIKQTADTAAFIHAMHTRDRDLLKRCLNDHIIEPQRKRDIPGFDEAKSIVMHTGGLNYNISGSGPSSFAFFEGATEAVDAGVAIEKMLAQKGIACDQRVTRVCFKGAHVIDG